MLMIRRGHKRTIIALAHKLLAIVFVILSQKKPYHDPKIDYKSMVVKRNAPRWIRSLKEYGYLK